MNDFHKWKLKECFVEIRSPGLAFIGERWFDEKGQPQLYYRHQSTTKKGKPKYFFPSSI